MVCCFVLFVFLFLRVVFGGVLFARARVLVGLIGEVEGLPNNEEKTVDYLPEMINWPVAKCKCLRIRCCSGPNMLAIPSYPSGAERLPEQHQ